MPRGRLAIGNPVGRDDRLRIEPAHEGSARRRRSRVTHAREQAEVDDMDTSIEIHRPRWVKPIAAVAAVLVVAGGIGYAVTNDQGDLAGRASEARAGAVTVRPELASPAPAEPRTAADQALTAGAGATSGAASVSGGANAAAASIGRGIPEVSKVIKTADLSIVVPADSFDARFHDATEVAEELGGFVESSSEGVRSGRLVMRIPARSFNEARSELKALALANEGVKREVIDGLDVTAEFVDLKARLEILQARKDALVKLLNQATTLETILRLNNVVDDVLTRIEELKGQIRLINDQTSKATVSLSMREEGVSVTPVVEKPSLGSALSHGIAGFLSVLYAIVVGLGYLIPVAVIAVLAWLVAGATRRRQGRTGANARA
jgi:Domain of unknown function (DUF4349)